MTLRDTSSCQGGKTVLDELAADSPPAKRLGNPKMVDVSTVAVVAAQDGFGKTLFPVGQRG
jgi:hypothetical protein